MCEYPGGVFRQRTARDCDLERCRYIAGFLVNADFGLDVHPLCVVEDVLGSSPPHYYLDDHLGTAQMELSAGGWPLWQGTFTPFGQEIVGSSAYKFFGQQPGDGTDNHYKFTGKERDAESGHIITVRPNNGPYTGSGSPSTGPDDPIINDIGRHIGVYPLSQQPSAGFRSGVIFYAPN